jgi:hypothetical protein
LYFCWDITIEADTKDTNPLKQWLKLPKGIITHIDVKFPAGCHGMVQIRLFRENLQLIPLSSDEWVTGDDETIPTNTYYELLDDPYKLQFKGCSPDCDYDHTVTVRIEVQPEQAAGVASLTRMVKMALEKMGLTK